MTEHLSPEQAGSPIVLFIPPEMNDDESAFWRQEITEEFTGSTAAHTMRLEDFTQMVQEALSLELPEFASASILLVTPEGQPFHVFITVSQPGGRPATLGESLLRVFGDDGGVELRSAEHQPYAIYQANRVAYLPAEEGEEQALIHTTVTTSTIDIAGLGACDVALSFFTTALEVAETAASMTVGIISDPDFADFLAA